MDLVKMSHLQRGELVIDDVVYRNVMYFPEEDPYIAIDTACAAPSVSSINIKVD